MRNLTLAVTEDTYRSARVWATLCNTSVSALVRSFLETLHNFPCPGVGVPEGGPDAPGAIPPTPLANRILDCETVERASHPH